MTRWVLAQQAVGEKTNNIIVILKSIDAMGCQKAITQMMVDAKTDDVLALKDSHKGLCADVSLRLDTETVNKARTLGKPPAPGAGRTIRGR